MADLTIDLATLNVTDNGPKVYQPQEPDLESLGSEDDGPPDFTLNMEKWMRGTEKWKKEGGRIENDRHDDEGQISEEKESAGGESVEDKKEDVGEDSDFLPLHASTPVPYLASKENVPEPSDTQNIAHRPSSRLHTEAVHTTTSDEVSDKIRDLQIKIEQLQMEDGKHQLVKNSLQLENSTLRDEIDGLRDELSEVRGTISKMRQQIKVTDKERESERKSQEEAKSKVSSLQNKLEPVVQELAIARSTAEVEKRHSEAKILVLEGKLLSTQETLMKQQIDAHFAQEIKNNENIRLKSELDICKGEARAYQQTLYTREEDHRVAVGVLHKKLDAGHEAQSRADVLKMELDHALEQLAESRRIVNTIEDENDRLTQENERQRDELNETATILTGKDASLAAAKSTIDELRDDVSRLKGEKNIGMIGEDVHDEEIRRIRQQYREELRTAQVVHQQKQSDLNANMLRLQDGMRREAIRLQRTHEDEIKSLKHEVATLKSRLRKSPTDLPAATIVEYRNTVRTLSTKLNVANETILSTRHSLAEAHKSLAISTSDVDRLNKKFEAFKPAVKKHYQDQLHQHELEWRTKMNAVLKDREVIVQQLFVMWGKEEMGIAAEGKKQPYGYKSLKKNGERILMAGEKVIDGERILQPGEKGKDAEHVPQPREKDKKDQRTVQIAETAKSGNQGPVPVIAEKHKSEERLRSASAALQDAKNENLIRELTAKYEIEQRLHSAIENAKNEALIQKIIEENQKPKEQAQTSSAAVTAAPAVSASAPILENHYANAKAATESLRRRMEEKRQTAIASSASTLPNQNPNLKMNSNPITNPDPITDAKAKATAESLRRRLEVIRDGENRRTAAANAATATTEPAPIAKDGDDDDDEVVVPKRKTISKREKREKLLELRARIDWIQEKYNFLPIEELSNRNCGKALGLGDGVVVNRGQK